MDGSFQQCQTPCATASIARAPTSPKYVTANNVRYWTCITVCGEGGDTVAYRTRFAQAGHVTDIHRDPRAFRARERRYSHPGSGRARSHAPSMRTCTCTVEPLYVCMCMYMCDPATATAWSHWRMGGGLGERDGAARRRASRGGLCTSGTLAADATGAACGCVSAAGGCLRCRPRLRLKSHRLGAQRSACAGALAGLWRQTCDDGSTHLSDCALRVRRHHRSTCRSRLRCCLCLRLTPASTSRRGEGHVAVGSPVRVAQGHVVPILRVHTLTSVTDHRPCHRCR